jgi:Tol biopolymer transport system component
VTDRMSGVLTDAAIERMLSDRAGEGAPAGLTASIIAAVRDAGRPRAGVGSLVIDRLPRSQGLLVAAAIALILVAAAVALVGASLLTRRDRLTVAPTPPANVVVATGSPAPSTAASTGPATPAPAGPPTIALYENHGTSADIVILDVSTGARTVIATIQAQGPRGAVQLSADGTRVTIFRLTDGAEPIAQVDRATGGIARLDPGLAGAQASVSPSGTRFAFVEGAADGGYSLSVVDADGNDISHTVLPADLVVMGAAEWAPDERSVLLTGCRPCNLLGKGPATETVSHLFVLPLDGSDVRELTSSATGQYTNAAWSPDGTVVAFSLDCEDGCATGISAVSLSDGKVAQLTTNRRDRDIAWSRDGRRIAFVRAGGPDRGLWVVGADGANAARLTAPSRDDLERSPLWSPAGDSIVYSEGPLSDTKLPDVWVVSTTTGEARLLVRNAAADS